jgi:alkylation response protein AidB-like acyl-CoA dehydrogenase
VVPTPNDPDARAAAALAREIVTREESPSAALDAAGLLDAALPDAVRVEVAREVGAGASCAAGLALFGDEPLTAAAVLGGAGEALAETGMAYARQRVVFGRPLATMAVQRMAFAGVAARVEAAVALVRRVAAGAGSDLDRTAVLPFALDAAWAAAEAALQVHGGYGYSDEYPVSRMWREVVAARVRYAAS